MDTLTIPVVVRADRRLVIDVPPSIPIGPAEVVIRTRESGLRTPHNEAREAARAKLLAAGYLSTEQYGALEATEVSDEDLAHLGQLSPGARPSEILIDEDRGAY